MTKRIILESIEVISEPEDAGSNVEIYFYFRPDNGDKNSMTRNPEKGEYSLAKKPGSMKKLGIPVDVENVLSVTLMEADSSSTDDNYGENAICAHSYSGSVVFDGKFRLNYTTDRAS